MQSIACIFTVLYFVWKVTGVTFKLNISICSNINTLIVENNCISNDFGFYSRSVLYYLGMAKMDLNPVQLGARLKIRDVSTAAS